VNLNRDERNPEIFHPYERTIKQLGSMADFEVCASVEEQPVAGLLAGLRTRLFNPLPYNVRRPLSGNRLLQPCLSLYRKNQTSTCSKCSDREAEIRIIAKEIKQLVLLEGYSLSEIALVVRQRAAYSDAIARIFEDEAIPCAIERRHALVEVPAVRAAQKLFSCFARWGDGSREVIDHLVSDLPAVRPTLSAREPAQCAALTHESIDFSSSSHPRRRHLHAILVSPFRRGSCSRSNFAAGQRPPASGG